MRLFVVCDWKDRESDCTPAQDGFWFHIPQDVKRVDIRSVSEGSRRLWCSPDPRPWKEPAWRRFLGKRICWLDLDELKGVLALLQSGEGAGAFMARFFPGFLDRGIIHSWELLPLWLRLKWVEHLARRVRGLDWSYLIDGKEHTPYGAVRLALGLDLPEKHRSYRPSTIPPPEILQRAKDLHRYGHGSVDCYPRLQPFSLGSPFDTYTSVELRWTGSHPAHAYGIMILHGEAMTKVPGGWFSTLDAVEEAAGGHRPGNQSGLIFSGSLSGALPSHNTLAALNRVSQTHVDAWRLLEVTEHALVRVAVCDERVQAWCDNSQATAARAVLRRVFSVFLKEPSIYRQAPKPAHGYWGALRRDSGRWSVDLRQNESEDGPSLLDVAFAGDCWPVAAEILLIHQGILDKWRASEEVPVGLELLDIKDDIPWIAVTSGRGKPEQIPFGVRFLPFTGLQACLIGERFDKLLLIRQLAACGGEV